MEDKTLKQIMDRFDHMDDLLSQVIDHQGKANQKLDELKTTTDTIKEQVVRNSEKLSTHDELLKELTRTQASIIKGQQKQDKILEMLAMRSLEQESDIKDLKRIK
jgi:DNA anti-recombination protein RmuC